MDFRIYRFYALDCRLCMQAQLHCRSEWWKHAINLCWLLYSFVSDEHCVCVNSPFGASLQLWAEIGCVTLIPYSSKHWVSKIICNATQSSLWIFNADVSTYKCQFLPVSANQIHSLSFYLSLFAWVMWTSKCPFKIVAEVLGNDHCSAIARAYTTL